jgi:hypothetical protein
MGQYARRHAAGHSAPGVAGCEQPHAHAPHPFVPVATCCDAGLLKLHPHGPARPSGRCTAGHGPRPTSWPTARPGTAAGVGLAAAAARTQADCTLPLAPRPPPRTPIRCKRCRRRPAFVACRRRPWRLNAPRPTRTLSKRRQRAERRCQPCSKRAQVFRAGDASLLGPPALVGIMHARCPARLSSRPSDLPFPLSCDSIPAHPGCGPLPLFLPMPQALP